MGKNEMIEIYAERFETTKKAAREAVDNMFTLFAETLATGESIAYAGFGTLSVIEKKATTARNPKTGETLEVPAKKAVKFKAGKNLKESVQ